MTGPSYPLEEPHSSLVFLGVGAAVSGPVNSGYIVARVISKLKRGRAFAGGGKSRPPAAGEFPGRRGQSSEFSLKDFYEKVSEKRLCKKYSKTL